MKLMLLSFWTSPEQDQALQKLAGKPAQQIKVAYIENAHDVYHDEAASIEGRKIIRDKGYDVEEVDLRAWKDDPEGLRRKLAGKDVFWFTGGNPYYLRWWLKATQADDAIRELVQQGKIYVGASAGGVVAGPTLRHFDELDDPAEAEEVIWEGLNLTPIVLIPHTDNPDFGAGCRKAGELLKAEGYPTQWITDQQAFVIDGDEQRVI
jgi:dipeptidase E